MVTLLIFMQINYLTHIEASTVPNSLVETENQELEEEESESKEKERQQDITIVILGTDERSTEVSRSDIIIIANYNPEDNCITLLSIPRDTRVYIPGKWTDKINHAYAYGGVDLLKQTLENFLETEIEYYIQISFKDFVNTMNALGGVEVKAEKDFYNSDGKVIIPEGEIILNGEEALYYVRFRNDHEGDIGRIKRQQEVIQSLTETYLRQLNIANFIKLVTLFKENTVSDINVISLISSQNTLLDIRDVKFDSYILKTNSKILNGIWYEIVDEEHLKEVKELLR